MAVFTALVIQRIYTVAFLFCSGRVLNRITEPKKNHMATSFSIKLRHERNQLCTGDDPFVYVCLSQCIKKKPRNSRAFFIPKNTFLKNQ